MEMERASKEREGQLRRAFRHGCSLLPVMMVSLLTLAPVSVAATPAAPSPAPTAPAPTAPAPEPAPTSSSGDESGFTQVGNFASDNATWFIVGLIALAVILAAIFIIRAGWKGKAPKGQPTAPAAAAPTRILRAS